MPAPKGNKNGQSAWMKPVSDELKVKYQGWVIASQDKLLEEKRKKRELTKSALVREALSLWLKHN